MRQDTTPNGLMLTLVLIVLSLLRSTHVVAQAPDVIDDPDAYAVYGAILQTQFRPSGTAPTSVTLLQETRRETRCARTAKVPDDWRETFESYRREIGRVRLIQQGFQLGLSYSVITMAELRTSMQTAGYDLTRFSGKQSPGAEVFARFPGGRLVAFSAVGFNATKNQAMLTVHFDCFPSLEPGAENSPCHQYDQVMMEKQQGRWVKARLGGCGGIA
jgi:hypothetical protein